MSLNSDTKSLWEEYYNAIRNQRWQAALSSLENIRQRKSDSFQVFLKMGDLLQRMQDITAAVNAYHTAAILLIKDGFLLKAIGIYKIILRLDQNNDEARIKIERVMNLLSSAKRGLTVYNEQPNEEIINEPETSPIVQADFPEAMPRVQGLDEYPEIRELKIMQVDQPMLTAGKSVREDVSPSEEGQVLKEGHFEEVAPEPSERTSLFPDLPDVTSLTKPTGADLPGNIAELSNGEKIAEFEDFDVLLQQVANESRLFESDAAINDGCPVCFLPLGFSRAATFIAKAPVRLVKAGDRIFSEGTFGDSIFLVTSGSVKLTVRIYTVEMVLTTLTDDDLFGELTFLTGRMRTISAVADTDCVLKEFDQLLMVEAITENPSIVECLNDLYLSRFSDTLRRVSES